MNIDNRRGCICRYKESVIATLPLVAAATIGISGLVATTQAHADPIIVTVTNVAVPNNEIVTITAPGLNVTAYTGRIQLTTSIGLLNVWCIDLYHDIGVGSVNLPYQFGTINTNFDGTTLTKRPR